MKKLHTIVVLVDNGDLGPVEKLHDVLISGVEQTLCGIEVDTELFCLRVQVQPGFQMWNVQCVADAMNVLAQDGIRWAEYCLHPVLDLLTRCNKRKSRLFICPLGILRCNIIYTSLETRKHAWFFIRNFFIKFFDNFFYIIYNIGRSEKRKIGKYFMRGCAEIKGNKGYTVFLQYYSNTYKYLTTNVRNVCNNTYTYTHIIYTY